MTTESTAPLSPPQTVTIDVYSDIVCPWCYIGHRRLETALAALPDDLQAVVTFRPYQLDPGSPDTPEPLRDRLQRKFGPQAASMLARVTQQAEGEGLEMNWERAISVNTRTAHRLLEFVRRTSGAARQRALMDELFSLYFTAGGNVGDVSQLAEAASRAGLDRETMHAYLESEAGVEELEREFDAARQLGVQAVPTFVINGRYGVQGAQPAATLAETIAEVARRQRP